MREMLVMSRRYGVGFERAWPSAYARVRWPHDTEHRQSWKALLDEQREDWRMAYEHEGQPRRSLTALYSLLSGVEDPALV
jgi:hypothetical protein